LGDYISTIDTELNYEFNDKLMVGVGVRYYTQSEVNFIAVEKITLPTKVCLFR